MNLFLLMKTMSKMKIQAPVNMMVGFPDETEKEIIENILQPFDGTLFTLTFELHIRLGCF